jgi:hypothetical protein
MRTLKTLSAMLLTASVLVACGGGSSDTAVTTTPSQPTVNSYQGNWSANFTGSDSGNCANIVIDSAGQVTGSCTSTLLGGASFGISGTVTSSGAAQFAAGGAATGATFKGTLTASSGSGTWANTGTSGTWTINKK